MGPTSDVNSLKPLKRTMHRHPLSSGWNHHLAVSEKAEIEQGRRRQDARQSSGRKETALIADQIKAIAPSSVISMHAHQVCNHVAGVLKVRLFSILLQILSRSTAFTLGNLKRTLGLRLFLRILPSYSPERSFSST